LFHLVSADSEDVAKDYQAIRKELGAYNPALLKKEEYLFLSRRDIVPEEEWQKKLAILKKFNSDAIAISVLDDATMAEVKKILNKIKDEKFSENEKNAKDADDAPKERSHARFGETV
ncbi:MAG: hypothetical protein V1489_00890, partial [Candidatus Liptonbacteria bacterium]